MYNIGIDLGGTNIAVAIVNEQGVIVAKKSTPTLSMRGYKAIVADMARLSKESSHWSMMKNKKLLLLSVKNPGFSPFRR